MNGLFKKIKHIPFISLLISPTVFANQDPITIWVQADAAPTIWAWSTEGSISSKMQNTEGENFTWHNQEKLVKAEGHDDYYIWTLPEAFSEDVSKGTTTEDDKPLFFYINSNKRPFSVTQSGCLHAVDQDIDQFEGKDVISGVGHALKWDNTNEGCSFKSTNGRTPYQPYIGPYLTLITPTIKTATAADGSALQGIAKTATVLDPSSNMVVNFESDRSEVPFSAVVHYREMGSENWQVAFEDTASHMHHILLSSLQSDTVYEYYVVSMEGQYGNRYTFKTASAEDNDQSRFLVVGDMQDNGEKALRWQDVANTILANHIDDFDFVITVGDMASDDKEKEGERHAYWQTFFRKGQEIFARKPIMPAQGNHDSPAGHHKHQLFIRGTNNNWGITPMYEKAEGIWQVDVEFGSDENERFKLSESEDTSDWSKRYGGSDGQLDDKNKSIQITEGQGLYRITANINTNTYKIDKAPFNEEYQSNYSQIYLRGTYNSWKANNKMRLVEDNTWHAVVTMNTYDKFKFDIEGDWDSNFGDSNQDFKANLSGSSIKVSSVSRDKNKRNYLVTFNDKTLEYTLTKLYVVQNGKTKDPHYLSGPHSTSFRKYFNLPLSAVYEDYYSFTYGNAKFMSVNSEIPRYFGEKYEGKDYVHHRVAAQKKWIDHELATSESTWNFTYWHIPPIISGDGKPEKKYLTPYTNNFHTKMDWVFSGHTHMNQRFKPAISINKDAVTQPATDYGTDLFSGTGYLICPPAGTTPRGGEIDKDDILERLKDNTEFYPSESIGEGNEKINYFRREVGYVIVNTKHNDFSMKTYGLGSTFRKDSQNVLHKSHTLRLIDQVQYSK